jgi:hypothetical protein
MGAHDLVQRATVMRFRTALTGEFRSWEEFSLAGFQVTCLPKAAFWNLKLPPRVLGRFVPQVNGGALAETWTMASRIPKDSQRDLCVIFLMGPAIAPAGELAAAISESRRPADGDQTVDGAGQHPHMERARPDRRSPGGQIAAGPPEVRMKPPAAPRRNTLEWL